MKQVMDNKEFEFSQLAREHKTTIYTVCYMFSKDPDEVNDLFQDILIKLWKGFASFKGQSQCQDVDLPCGAQRLFGF